MNFDDRLSKFEYKLNETDLLISEFLKENRENISSISIKDVAGALFIAPNAIMRFSKKLEYSGFSELKALMNVEDNNISEKIPGNISKTLDLIDEVIQYRVVEEIRNCEKVFLFGTGEMTYYADLVSFNLKVLKKEVSSFSAYTDIEYHVANCDENDLVIMISPTGENEKLIKYTEELREKKVTVVVISHFNNNSLSQLADYNLYFWGEERMVSGYDVSDKTGLMIALRSFSECFWKNYYEEELQQ